jgi:hypothetical protein
MRRLRLSLPLLAAVLLSALSVSAQTTTLTTTGDTYLKKGSPNQNQGAETSLRVQSSGQNRALVAFDPNAILNAVGAGTLVSATLELNIAANANNWGTTGRTVDAHRLTVSWTESGATWNCAADSNPSNSSPDCTTQWAGGTYQTTPTASVLHTDGLTGTVSFNVAADIEALRTGAPLFGWLIRKTDEGDNGEVQYSAREAATGFAPRLVLVVESPLIDEVPPAIEFTAPAFPVVVNNTTPTIALSYGDGGSGVNTSSVHVLVDGSDITASCTIGTGSASCQPLPLSAATHLLTARVSDLAGNQSTATYEVQIMVGDKVTLTLPMRYDTYLRAGSPNQNQGAESTIQVRSDGQNRVLVAVDQAELLAALAEEPLFSATLELFITENGNNWGPDGRTVDVHRMSAEFSELGATWNCAEDLDTTNSQPDCSPELGPAQWGGGSFESEPTDTVVHRNGMSGWVQFDVTADIHAFRDGEANYGWMIKKSNEADPGRAVYGTKEGDPAHAPRLTVVIGPGGVDQSPPALEITQPSTSLIAGTSTPAIALTYRDTASGVDLTTLHVIIDGTEITNTCNAGADSATCTPPSLAVGSHTLSARVKDTAGNEASASFTFEIFGDGTALTSFTATADTFLRHGAPNQNEGEESYLRIKASGWNRALVRFDQQAIASAIGTGPVVKAMLELYIEKNRNNWGTSGRTVDLHRMSADWQELTATWNCADDANPGNHQPDCQAKWNGGTFTPEVTGTVLHTKGLTGWIQYDVTADLNAFLTGTPNYGWIVKKTDERKAGFVLYTAREGTAGRHPRLVVAYHGGPTTTPSAAPATVTATHTAGATPTESQTPQPSATVTAEPTSTTTTVPSATVSAAPTPTSTAVPTDTPTANPTETATVTPTATDTPTPTITPTETATETHIPTETETSLPTATETATWTHTPTDTPTPTLTATPTPIPQGKLLGEVFDDDSALPLAGVTAKSSLARMGEGQGEGDQTTTDTNGRYMLTADAGEQWIELSKGGYTRAMRNVTVLSQRGARVRDARLTKLSDPNIIGATGGTVNSPIHLPPLQKGGEGGFLALTVAPNTFTTATAITLTTLSPQGLIAPVPLGWSVLLGADMQTSGSGLETAGSTWATLRVPLDVLPPISLPIIAAIWDDETRQWFGGPEVTEATDAITIAVPATNHEPPTTNQIQLALLVPDSTDLQAVEGQPLLANEPLLATDLSAALLTNPLAMVSDLGSRSVVQVEMYTDTPAPSGSVIEARLSESYDLRDGSFVEGVSSQQDFSLYRTAQPVTCNLTPETCLGAYFPIAPSIKIPLSDLVEGRITVDLLRPGAAPAEEPGVITAENGGQASGPGGVSVHVPAGAVDQDTIITVAPGRLPAGLIAPPDLVALLELQATGGALAPGAAYGFDLGTAVTDGQQFLVARVAVVDGRLVLAAVGFGEGQGGEVIFTPCAPSAPSVCLPGLPTPDSRLPSISLVFLTLPANSAIVTGTVADVGGPRAGIAVRSNTTAVVSVTDANGTYVLPAPQGLLTTLTARDPANDETGTVTVTPNTSIVTVDIELLAQGPEVTAVNPPNHASNVALDATIMVSFSKPLLTTSVTSDAFHVNQVRTKGERSAVAGRISFNADATTLTFTPTNPLASDALHEVILTAAITDRHGHPLTTPDTQSPTPGFRSDFTTSAIFKAAALPPGTLRLSIPDIDGKVFLCAGSSLAVPGDPVIVENRATGLTVAVQASMGSGEPNPCEVDFPDLCNTDTPGSFCAALDTVNIGDRITVTIRDAFGNDVTIEAGPMRDDETGATVIGAEGGVVTAPVPGAGDPPYDPDAYRLMIPKGAFEEPTLVTIAPAFADEFPPGTEKIAFVGGARADFGGVTPRLPIDLAVPALPGASLTDQYLGVRIFNLRGYDELEVVDLGFLDEDNGLATSEKRFADQLLLAAAPRRTLFARLFEPAAALAGQGASAGPVVPYPGFTQGGVLGFYQATECTAHVSGWVAVDDLKVGIIASPFEPSLVQPITHTGLTEFTVPVPCNKPFEIKLTNPDGEVIDFLTIDESIPRGQFVNSTKVLSDDQTPPTASLPQASPPNPASCAEPPCRAKDVGHDQVLSIPFSEAIFSGSIEGNLAVCCELPGLSPTDGGPLCKPPEVELHGRWVESADFKRLFFIAKENTPAHGLPLGAKCRVVVKQGGVSDGRNPIAEAAELFFDTFTPYQAGHLAGIDARSVEKIGWYPYGDPSNARLYIAIGEGEPRPGHDLGNVVIADVTSNEPDLVIGYKTEGADWGLQFVEAEEFTSAAGKTYQGPYLLDATGAGVHDAELSRTVKGTLRLFDLSQLPHHLPLIMRRHLNHSPASWEELLTLDPISEVQRIRELRQLEPEIGIPLDVTNIGVEAAYVANSPVLGFEGVKIRDFEATVFNGTVPKGGPDARLIVPTLRGITALKNWVIGNSGNNGLVVAPAALGVQQGNAVKELYGGAKVAGSWVLGVPDWPVDIDRDGRINEQEEVFDLVATPCLDGSFPAICVAPLDAANGNIDSSTPGGALPAVPSGVIRLPSGSSPLAAVVDSVRRLLYVANCNAGVTVIDLQDPRGRIDEDAPQNVDDRVLASIPLSSVGATTACAARIAFDVNPQGHTIAYVAAWEDGVFLVDLGPARMDVHLEGIPPRQTFPGLDRVRIDEVRYFNEMDSTFYEPAVQVQASLAQKYGNELKVAITALDARGNVVVPPMDENGQPLPGFADPEATVRLGRVPRSNLYHLNPNWARLDQSHRGGRAVLVSNLPLSEVAELTDGRCPSDQCQVIYGGIGGSIEMEALIAEPVEGRSRELPLEKVGVILLGIDGLRQDVLYPEGGDDVSDPFIGDRIRLAPATTPGFQDIMGGARRDIEAHSLMLRGATAIFPSITLASWASVESGNPPSLTGELGNEFFDREGAAGGVPGVPPRRRAPIGMVTYASGAFPGYDTYSVGEKRTWNFVPPGRPEPGTTAQNQRWKGSNLWNDLRTKLPGFAEHFGAAVVAGAHYARDLEPEHWLTIAPSRVDQALDVLGDAAGHPFCLGGSHLSCAERDSEFVDEASRDYLFDFFTDNRVAWRSGAAHFPGVLMLYLMGPDHVGHEAGMTGAYRNFIRDKTGHEHLTALRNQLVEMEEYYNKIFVIAADHGHTETGATGGREEWTEDNWQTTGPGLDSANHHMHLREFLALIQLIGSKVGREFAVLQPDPIPESGAPNRADINTRDIVVALNGAMAHVYVRSRDANGNLMAWSKPPCQEDRDAIGNGMVAALGGVRAAFGTSVDLYTDAALFEPQPAVKPLLKLIDAIDFVLVRKGDEYVVRKPFPAPEVWPPVGGAPVPEPSRPECAGRTLPPSTVEEFALEQWFADFPTDYVDAANRIREMQHATRSGDIVIVFRSRTDELPSNRYVSAGNIPSWHGSLNRSDSYVPFIVSYPGGNAPQLDAFVEPVCGSTNRCPSTLKVVPLIEKIIAEQLPGATEEMEQGP